MGRDSPRSATRGGLVPPKGLIAAVHHDRPAPADRLRKTRVRDALRMQPVQEDPMADDDVLAPNEQNLVWIDMEMTGLDPMNDRIIEIAVVVTDPLIRHRVEGPVIAVHQSDTVLDGMDAWNKGTHGKSGLVDRVKASSIDEVAAQAEVIAFLAQYVPARTSPMCGNTICQDRRFLANYMPQLEAFFHYRNLDVSTLKELARRWKPDIMAGFTKRQAHTALADIHESIDELVYYRQHLLNV
jgi:oligoribonuclease